MTRTRNWIWTATMATLLMASTTPPAAAADDDSLLDVKFSLARTDDILGGGGDGGSGGGCPESCTRGCGTTAIQACGSADNVASYRCWEDAPGRCVCEYSCRNEAAVTSAGLFDLPVQLSGVFA